MRPLTILIPGKFWDSQLYMGRLYLWTIEGAILTYDWDRIVGSLVNAPKEKLAIECAFSRSDFLYGAHLASVFRDPDVVALLKGKFAKAARTKYEITAGTLRNALLGHQDTPFAFPHTDSTIFKRHMFVGSRMGLFTASCGKRTLKPVSTRTERVWDGVTTGISASTYGIAIAAGSDGLWEVPRHDSSAARPVLVSEGHASSCEWTYWSIYASSHASGGYLADYTRRDRHPDEIENYGTYPEKERAFHGVFDGADIFGTKATYTWGTKDKFCSATRARISVRQYKPWLEGDARVISLGHVDDALVGKLGELVSAKTASFGVVLEYDDTLLVVDSTNEDHHLPGAPVNWRVFPRSKRYENHLHVVRTDCIEIISFNHDYFVDQKSKVLGTLQHKTQPD